MDPDNDQKPSTLFRFLGSPAWDGVSGILAFAALLLSIGSIWELATGKVWGLLWLQATSIAVPILVTILIATIAVAGFVAFAWRTTTHKSPRRHRSDTRREARFPVRSRYLALAFIATAAMFGLVVTVGYRRWVDIPHTVTTVLVADFLDSNGIDSLYVTRDLAAQVQRAVIDFPNIEIRPLGWAIEDRRGEGTAEARRIGELAKANIVIWGDYRGESEPVTYVHFDLIKDSQPLLGIENIKRYGIDDVRAVAIAQQQLSLPDSVDFSIALGDHLGALVAFAGGVTLFESGAYTESIQFLDRASESYDNPLSGQIEPAIRFMRGNAHFFVGNADLAMVELTTALESLNAQNSPRGALSPALVYFSLGNVRIAQGDLSGAIDDYDQVIFLDPGNAYAYYNRANARLSMQDNEGAISDYDQAIALRPEYVAAYNNRGVARGNLGNDAGALMDFNSALALDSTYAAAFENRGLVRLRQNDVSAAMSDYDQAIRLNPTSAGSYYNRGNAHRNQGNLTGALSDLNRSLSLDPAYAAAYISRGMVYRAQGKFADAMNDYGRALELDPGLASAYNNRGVARYYNGDLSGAILDYERAIELEPDLSSAYLNRGAAYAAQGDPNSAIVDFDRAIAMNPQDAGAYGNRGRAHATLENWSDALSDFDRAIVLDPQTADTYVGRGYVRYHLGDYAGAKGDFEKAIELDLENADAHYNMGKTHASQGDNRQAILDFDRVIELEPANANAYINRGYTHLALDEIDSAIADFERYVELAPDAPDRQDIEQQISDLKNKAAIQN